jgi:hypothetical protein
VSVPRCLEGLGVAAAVLSGLVIQLVAASTSEERRTVARQLDTQISVLVEELDAYRSRIARKPRTPQSEGEVMKR